MRITLVAAAVGVALFALGNASVGAQNAQPVNPPIQLAQANPPPEGNTTTVSPAEHEKLKAERAGKQEAKAKGTAPAKPKATMEPMTPEGNTTAVSRSESEKLKAERAAKKQTKSQMTAEQKKAKNKESQKQIQEMSKSAGGTN